MSMINASRYAGDERVWAARARLTSSQVPVGPWPKDPKMKEIGRYQREHMAMGTSSPSARSPLITAH